MARLKRPTEEVADVLLRWMVTRRWYRGGTHAVQSARVVDTIALPSSPPAVLVLLQVRYRDTEPVTYVVPLTTDEQFDADGLVAEQPQAAIARLVGEGSSARLLDGSLVPGVFEALLGIATGRRTAHGVTRDLVGHTRRGLRTQMGRRQGLVATPIPDQLTMSNSSAAFADRLVLKLFRVLEDGPNPDIEVATFLAKAGFANAPRVLGSVEVAQGQQPEATLAVAQAFVPHEGNLWESMRQSVEAFLYDTVAERGSPELEADGDLFFLGPGTHGPAPRSAAASRGFDADRPRPRRTPGPDAHPARSS